jgi:hypothetical protein
MGIWMRATRHEGESAVTWVAAPEDLAMDIHQVANDTRQKFGNAVDVEIFEFEGTLIEATIEADRRSKTRLTMEKRFRDALHDFLIATFIISKEKTMITPASPVPMDAAAAREVLLEVMQHPAYKGQIVVLRSSDKKGILLEKNLVMVKDL